VKPGDVIRPRPSAWFSAPCRACQDSCCGVTAFWRLPAFAKPTAWCPSRVTGLASVRLRDSRCSSPSAFTRRGYGVTGLLEVARLRKAYGVVPLTGHWPAKRPPPRFALLIAYRLHPSGLRRDRPSGGCPPSQSLRRGAPHGSLACQASASAIRVAHRLPPSPVGVTA
jgi:hypothetical protein